MQSGSIDFDRSAPKISGDIVVAAGGGIHDLESRQ
jgi:hypothetical protein